MLWEDKAKLHTAFVSIVWLCHRGVWVLDLPAYSSDLSPTENIWSIMTHKIQRRRPRTVEQLESYIRQEWDNIPLQKVQQLVSLSSRCVQTVLRVRGDNIQWETSAVPTFCDVLLIQDALIFLMK